MGQQAKDVKAIGSYVQYLAQRKIDIDAVLTQHDGFVKDPSSRHKQEN